MKPYVELQRTPRNTRKVYLVLPPILVEAAAAGGIRAVGAEIVAIAKEGSDRPDEWECFSESKLEGRPRFPVSAHPKPGAACYEFEVPPEADLCKYIDFDNGGWRIPVRVLAKWPMRRLASSALN